MSQKRAWQEVIKGHEESWALLIWPRHGFPGATNRTPRLGDRDLSLHQCRLGGTKVSNESIITQLKLKAK